MDQPGRISLFLSSYLVLFIALLIMQLNKISFSNSIKVDYIRQEIWTYLFIIILLALSIWSIISTVMFVKTYQSSSGDRRKSIHIESLAPSSHEVIAYLLTMVIPLINQNLLPGTTSNWSSFVTAGIIIIGIATLYINSSLIVINPTLMLAGIRIYKIQYISEYTKEIVRPSIEGILLTKKEYDYENIPSSLIVEKIDKGIYMAN